MDQDNEFMKIIKFIYFKIFKIYLFLVAFSLFVFF